jgi:DNA-binding transcriptional LysR family regulator
MAVSPVALTDPDLEEEVLLQEELFLACAPALQPVPSELGELAALPWIVTSSPNAIRGLLSAVFTQAGLEPNIVAEINSLPMVIRAVQQNLGVTLLPRAAIGEALAAGTVVVSQFMQPAPQRSINLYRRRDKSTTPAERLVHGVVIEIGAALRSSIGVK